MFQFKEINSSSHWFFDTDQLKLKDLSVCLKYIYCLLNENQIARNSQINDYLRMQKNKLIKAQKLNYKQKFIDIVIENQAFVSEKNKETILKKILELNSDSDDLIMNKILKLEKKSIRVQILFEVLEPNNNQQQSKWIHLLNLSQNNLEQIENLAAEQSKKKNQKILFTSLQYNKQNRDQYDENNKDVDNNQIYLNDENIERDAKEESIENDENNSVQSYGEHNQVDAKDVLILNFKNNQQIGNDENQKLKINDQTIIKNQQEKIEKLQFSLKQEMIYTQKLQEEKKSLEKQLEEKDKTIFHINQILQYNKKDLSSFRSEDTVKKLENNIEQLKDKLKEFEIKFQNQKFYIEMLENKNKHLEKFPQGIISWDDKQIIQQKFNQKIQQIHLTTQQQLKQNLELLRKKNFCGCDISLDQQFNINMEIDD